ncbi:homeobox-domain-containing protein, partial [Calocera cornea HHB12733]
EDGEEFGFSQPDDIKRRRRTTPEELAVLEAEYAKCTLPDAKNRVRIGQMTNMSARSVQIWFQNKRQTDKRKAQGL